MAMIIKKRTKQNSPDAVSTSTTKSPLDELFDPVAFEDRNLSVDDILAEYHKREQTSIAAQTGVDTPPLPNSSVADPIPSSAELETISTILQSDAVVEESTEAEVFEPADPEELAQAEAEVASMKADIVGQFQSVDNIYRCLGVEETETKPESAVKSMLKRWDFFSKLQRNQSESNIPDGISTSQLPTEETPVLKKETLDKTVLSSDPLDTPAVSEEKSEKDSIPAIQKTHSVVRAKLQTLTNRLPKQKAKLEPDPDLMEQVIRDIDADNNPIYAAPQENADGNDSDFRAYDVGSHRTWSLKAVLTGHFVTFLASIATLRDKNGAAVLDLAAQVHDPEDDRADVPPAKAAKLYGKQAQQLRPRATIASVLALVLLLVSCFHLAGVVLPDFMFDIRFMALLCLVIQLLISLLGLDIFVTGVYNLIDGVPGMETLVSVSCITSAVDALVIYLSGNTTYGIPFCAVSALSMVFALWGSYLYCLGYRFSFRTLAQIQTPTLISSEQGLSEQGNTLLRSYDSVEHFIQRSEAPDLAESTYRLFTPLFLIVSLIFGLLFAIGHGGISGFLHCFSACISACTSFPTFLCFAKPFSAAAKKLRRKGCAIAGFTGCREIGSSSRIVVYDEDLFPSGTVVVDRVITSNEMLAKKLTIYTASLLHESESALTPAFDMLLSRKGQNKMTVRKFVHQEGGGFSGIINEEQVLVGPAAFLDLMGIRIPQRLKMQASVFTAINGQLAGAFCLKYNTTTSSRMAFDALFKSNHHPFFVVRDFNVTPMLIQQHFGASPAQFEFPAFSDRYRISVVHAEKPPAAVLSKNEIGPLADCVSICYQLYSMTRRSVLLSLLGSAVGLLSAFVLCWLGLFQVISAAGLSGFMLLWLVLTSIFSTKRK